MGARSHCEDAGGRQSRRAAGVWIFLSQARLWTAAKKQAQKEVPDMGCATAGQMPPWKPGGKQHQPHSYTDWTLQQKKDTLHFITLLSMKVFL